MPARLSRPRRPSGLDVGRLRALLPRPILQAAITAVVAWYVAKLTLGDRETGFAPIAALICLGAALGQQRRQALELAGGVLLGVLIADLLVRVIGSGPPQVGLMVVLAMAIAALMGGRAAVMTEAGVSAIIVGSSHPASLGIVPVRPLEGLIGGTLALVSYALVFPPDPVLQVARAAQAIFAALGATLQKLTRALAEGDLACAEGAVQDAGGMDAELRAFGEAMYSARETARISPVRRPVRTRLDVLDERTRHLEFAVRNTRVLARDVLRFVRLDGAPVPDLAAAVGDLAEATWALAAAFEDPGAREDPVIAARRAATRATEAMARHADIGLTEIAGRVRSTAADLVRAAQAAAGSEAGTDELLLDEP